MQIYFLSWKTLHCVFMNRFSKTTTALIYVVDLQREEPYFSYGLISSVRSVITGLK